MLDAQRSGALRLRKPTASLPPTRYQTNERNSSKPLVERLTEFFGPRLLLFLGRLYLSSVGTHPQQRHPIGVKLLVALLRQMDTHRVRHSGMKENRAEISPKIFDFALRTPPRRGYALTHRLPISSRSLLWIRWIRSPRDLKRRADGKIQAVAETRYSRNSRIHPTSNEQTA